MARAASAPHAISRAAATLALLTILTWATGRLASDRWLWSQYIFWVPEELYALVAVSLTLLAALSRLSGRRVHPRRRISALSLAALGCVVLAAHLTLAHWRLFNYLNRAQPPSLRILNWNTTAIEDAININGPLAAHAPDVAIMANPMSRLPWREVIDAFPDPKGLAWDSGFMVLSHIHIIRHGVVSLGIQGAFSQSQGGPRWPDAGRAMFIELDTAPQLGRTTVIWAVDLPSDWRRSRWEMAASASAAIAHWSGPEILHDRVGNIRAASPAAVGFPAPDIILGDFNSPRGSASQRLLTGAMANAFDQAGSGYAASWPDQRAPFPLFHLDHIFLAPWLRATRYDLPHPPFAYHRPQIAEIIAAPPAPPTRSSRE